MRSAANSQEKEYRYPAPQAEHRSLRVDERRGGDNVEIGLDEPNVARNCGCEAKFTTGKASERNMNASEDPEQDRVELGRLL